MAMKREQEFIKKRLDDELAMLYFNREEEVLRRTHPRSWHERLKALWNKELEVPLLPIGMSVAMLFAVVAVTQLQDFQNRQDTPSGDHRQLIEAGGNTYWKDDYEKVVNAVEGDHKS